MHPNEICGLVLIEATAPEDVSLMQASQSRLQMRLQRLSDWLFDRAGIGEARNASISASMVQAAGRFPDVPLTVVSGGHAAMPPHMPEQAKSGRLLHQQRLSRASIMGQHVIAKRSGHFPQFSEPELINAVILEVLAEVREIASA